MRTIILSLALVFIMCSSALAAGPFTVNEVRYEGSTVVVIFNYTANGSLKTRWIKDDLNRKYFLSILLTAMSTGQSVSFGSAKEGAYSYINKIMLYKD